MIITVGNIKTQFLSHILRVAPLCADENHDDEDVVIWDLKKVDEFCKNQLLLDDIEKSDQHDFFMKMSEIYQFSTNFSCFSDWNL